MISEFMPKNIMISDFWAIKLPNNGMATYNRLANLMENKLFYCTSFLK